MIVGTGLGAEQGVLIRSGEALETTHKVTVAIFDKTGTITKGEPMVSDLISNNKDELLKNAYSLEKLSKHPLSKAICQRALENHIGAKEIYDFQDISGRGLMGRDESNDRILIGNTAFMSEEGISLNKYETDLKRLSDEGKTVAVVAYKESILGLIAMADVLKEEASEAILELKNMGVKTVLLTGDNKQTAEFIGKSIGIDEVVAEVFPTQKADIVKKYQSKSEVVMMVGDGINDAPALAQADIGCAIGNGSDIAIDCANIVLMKSNLNDVIKAIHLSRLTIKNIKQNLFWAFCYNVLGIPIAAGVLYPTLGVLLSPMIGAFDMSLSSLFVVGNALRLKGRKI